MNDRLLLFVPIIATAMMMATAIPTSRTDISLSAWQTQALTQDDSGTASRSYLSQKSPDVSREGVSHPLALTGDVGFNITQALNARNGALRHVVIRPGETWSFNATIGSPVNMELRAINGISGGGWCNLASRYVQAARTVLPPEALHFTRHSPPLSDVSPDDSVRIWNPDGRPGSFDGRFDLEITNVHQHPLVFSVEQDPRHPGHIVVRARIIR